MQFLQWLLHRNTASFSNTFDNDNLNSATPEPYFPNESITIDDSSDDEHVNNLMLDVDNLSKVPPFSLLDLETRRTDVSLHVPPKANPDAEDITASPTERRSSRPKRSSLCNKDAREISSISVSKRSKVFDKASN